MVTLSRSAGPRHGRGRNPRRRESFGHPGKAGWFRGLLLFLRRLPVFDPHAQADLLFFGIHPYDAKIAFLPNFRKALIAAGAAVFDLGNVAQPFDALFDFCKHAKRRSPGDFGVYDVANVRLGKKLSQASGCNCFSPSERRRFSVSTLRTTASTS